MTNLNLQFFGGRGSNGGKSSDDNPSFVNRLSKGSNYKRSSTDGGTSEVLELNKRDRADRDLISHLQSLGFSGTGHVFTRVTSADVNSQELARATREARLSGAVAATSLKKGEAYSIKWGKGNKTGTYLDGKVVNGIAVRRFKDSKTGKILVVDNEDVEKDVSKI